MSGRDQGRAENCSDSTSAKVSTDGPDDESQLGPKQNEARHRADRSSVAGPMMQTSSRQPRSRQVRCCRISSRQQTSLRRREEESEKAPDRGKIRRQRGTKPGQRRRIRIEQKDCTVISKVVSSSSSQTVSQNSKAWELQPAFCICVNKDGLRHCIHQAI